MCDIKARVRQKYNKTGINAAILFIQHEKMETVDLVI